MSNFLKHVGKQGDRKVVILFKEVPNEDHMCLVIYPDVLPAPWEDAIMRALTSDMGQQADEFANALHRTLLPDGRVVLETLHMEKMIKKIRTADVIVTPRSDSSIRLDELNKMLREMKTGEEAIKRMAENDAARGLVDAPTKRAAEQAYKEGRQQSVARAQAPQDGALDDRAIAGNMLAQATRMEAEAKGLIAEAARMKKEAERMDPTVTAAKIPTQQPAKRGRPSKATKAVADAAQ
jgi:hypothetical protein